MSFVFPPFNKVQLPIKTKGHLGYRYVLYIYTLRIQVCPKKGITPTFLFFSDGIGTPNPTLGTGLDS